MNTTHTQATVGPWHVKGVHVGPTKHFRAYTIEPNICEMNSSIAPDEVTAMLDALKEFVAEIDLNDESVETGAYHLAQQAIAIAQGGFSHDD